MRDPSIYLTFLSLFVAAATAAIVQMPRRALHSIVKSSVNPILS